MKSSLTIKAPLIKTPIYDLGFGKKVITVNKLPITNDEYTIKVQEVAKAQNIPLKTAEAVVQSKVVEVEAFNKIMDYISSLFEFKIDPQDLKQQISLTLKNPLIEKLQAENKAQFVEDLARKTIMKKLIFQYLIRQYNQLDVSLSDAEIIMKNNNLLVNIADNKKVTAIKNFQANAMENKIVDWLIRQYKIVISLKPTKS